MPLSDPDVERRHYHTRAVEVQGYFRADGLWDIEGRMRDTKTYAFSNTHRGTIPAGEPIHDMVMRLTIDDNLVIHGAEASTEHGPYRVCGDIAPRYERLIGLRIGPGFHRRVKEQLGGIHGCTHITEMLYPMATVAFQTAYTSRNKAREDFGIPVEPPPTDAARRPGHLNSCHALDVRGPVVQEVWPAYYEGE